LMGISLYSAPVPVLASGVDTSGASDRSICVERLSCLYSMCIEVELLDKKSLFGGHGEICPGATSHQCGIPTGQEPAANLERVLSPAGGRV
jgi:hypothetical protein